MGASENSGFIELVKEATIKQSAPTVWATALAHCRIIPALAWVVVPTLVVRGHFTPILSEAAHIWLTPTVGDTRSWWKAVFVCGIGLWMVLHLFCRLLSGWRPRHRIFAILLGAALVSAAISTYLSPFPKSAWLGYTTLYEGFPVLFSYLVATWYVAEMLDTGILRLWLVRAIGMVGFLNGCHGVLEGFGWHFWRTDFGLWLMGAGERDAVTFLFSGSGMAYGTVFQPNHYGMLMAMLSVLAFGMFRCDQSRNWRLFWMINFIISTFGLFFSNSRTGIFTFIAIVIVFAILKFSQAVRSRIAIREIRQNFPMGIICLVAVACVAVGAFIGFEPVRSSWNRLVRRSLSLTEKMVKNPTVQAVGLQENRIHIRFADKEISLEKRSADSWRARQEGQSFGRTMVLKFVPKTEGPSGWYEAKVPFTSDVVLSYRERGNVKLTAPDVDLEFFAVGTRLWAVDPVQSMAYETLRLSPYVPSGREGFLSARGYIWARIWEPFREHPLFGSGPGTFALVFPNEDLLDKNRYSYGKDVDKGHGFWSMFLVQLGVFGVLSFLAPVVYVLWLMIRKTGALRQPLLLAMIAYSVCALTNDSTLGVTPIFCALLGMGLTDAIGVNVGENA